MEISGKIKLFIFEYLDISTSKNLDLWGKLECPKDTSFEVWITI
jgi:hypothetical protein